METDDEMHWTWRRTLGVIAFLIVIAIYLAAPAIMGEKRPPSDPLPSDHSRF